MQREHGGEISARKSWWNFRGIGTWIFSNRRKTHEISLQDAG